ncbi:chorismate mutase [Candidatus Woesearchaeota archaeon]|nr:chorismate mutase [Candidatus Woesearchaeota archaeon]
MGELDHYRKRIDGIDKKIAKLLNSRFLIAGKISSFKKSSKIMVTDKKRELKVLSNIKKYSKSHQKFLTVIFKKIIACSKKLQR